MWGHSSRRTCHGLRTFFYVSPLIRSNVRHVYGGSYIPPFAADTFYGMADSVLVGGAYFHVHYGQSQSTPINLRVFGVVFPNVLRITRISPGNSNSSPNTHTRAKSA